MPQFFQLLHDHDDFFAELLAEDRHLDEARVLVTVADDEAAHLVLQRKSGEQFRLAADFQAEIERLARIQDFLHHFAKLVHLDGKHAAIAALVIELGDRVAEREVDGLDAMAEDVLKTDEDRKFQITALGFLDDIVEIDRCAGFLLRGGHHASGLVDIEIFRAPALDVVHAASGLEIPGSLAVGRVTHLDASNQRTI